MTPEGWFNIIEAFLVWSGVSLLMLGNPCIKNLHKWGKWTTYTVENTTEHYSTDGVRITAGATREVWQRRECRRCQRRRDERIR
jgi:hypothetical protein